MTMRTAGFTLVELLVVIAMLGILAVAAGLSVGGARDGDLSREAERLRRSLELAADEAMWSGAVLTWRPTGDGYRFDCLGAGCNPASADALLKPYRLPPGLRIGAVALEAQALVPGSALRFAPGPAPLFGIDLADERRSVHIEGRADGSVAVRA